MAKSCITQMANQLRYAFPWAMHALKTAPPSHCTSPQTTPHIQVYSRAWLSFLKNVAMSVCTTSVQNVLASSAQRILMVNMDIAVANTFYSMNLTLSMCHLFCLPFVPKTVSQPSSSPTSLPHPPNHLQSSPTPSTYTPVSLRCTLCKLAQPHHSCGWTKLRSMSNFPRLTPYVSGRHLFVFFSICRICLMHFH